MALPFPTACSVAVALLVAASACSEGEAADDAAGPAAPGADGGALPGVPTSSSSSGGAPGVDGGPDEPSGPRVMVRLGNYATPTFLDLDACFGYAAAAGTTWTGPYWRDDWAHGAGYKQVTAYRRIGAGPQTIRFVSHESADCNTGVVGLPDQPLDVPLIAGGHDAWFTVMAYGTAGAFGIATLTDRESVADTPFGLRLVSVSAALGTLELGTIPDPSYEGYDGRIQNVSFGAPSEYTSWPKQLETPLYFGFKVFPQGHTTGEPMLVGDRAQSEATGKGSWTVFVIPKSKPDGNVDYTLCADGADAPRLCYPCGRPSCEGL